MWRVSERLTCQVKENLPLSFPPKLRETFLTICPNYSFVRGKSEPTKVKPFAPCHMAGS